MGVTKTSLRAKNLLKRKLNHRRVSQLIEMMFCPLVSFFSFTVDSKCSLTPLLSKTERERGREIGGD